VSVALPLIFGEAEVSVAVISTSSSTVDEVSEAV
jgi:predicted phage tail protein